MGILPEVNMASWLVAVSLILAIVLKCNGEVSLSDDPSLFPGHLEPIGSKRPMWPIETVDEYPSPHGETGLFYCSYLLLSSCSL